MNENPINFQFLRDCITALNAFKGSRFYMGKYMYDNERKGGALCGTPACVLGHYIVWEERQRGLAVDGAWRDGRIDELSLVARPIEGEDTDSFFERVRSALMPQYSRAKPSPVHEFTGLTRAQTVELFGARGCGDATKKPQAIAYLKRFIVLHGGSLQNPKPVKTPEPAPAKTPDWEQLSTPTEEIKKEKTCPST